MGDIDIDFLDFDKENELREEIYVSKKRSYQNTDFDSYERSQRIKRIAKDISSPIEEEVENVSVKHLLTNRPTDAFQDFIRISSLNGKMFYALYDDNSENDEIFDYNSVLSTSNLLKDFIEMPFSYDEYLSSSLDDIKMMVEELEKQEKFHEELIKNIRNKKTSDSGDINDYLLVDKYSPKSFIDLLSDEKVNRSVFEWIKEWDPLVFNKGKDKSKKTPPEKRILLLSGPPGIGKTTLARVIAKSAGYEPIECNASDDRTGSKFILKVKDVVENDSLLVSDHKPKCLIIDEIDGIYHHEGKGAIDVLLSLIDDNKNKNNKNKTLKRPIICICNDLYAPSLNRLRDKALIYKLNPPDITTLMTRIQSICKKENIKIDHRAIQILCEMNNCDIRSSLNTLQFLSANNKTITVDSFTKSSTFGQKDMTENIYDIWKAIFYNQQNSNDIIPLMSSNSKTFKRRQLDRFFSMVKSDQSDLIMDGVYENMLALKYHDHLLNKTIESLEWFQFYDIIKKNINAYQNFELVSFIPCVVAGIHSNIRTDFMGTYIQYPRKDKIAKNVKKRMKNIVKSLYKYSEIFVRTFNNDKVFIKDLCSYLLDIITPNFRPVSVHLRDKHEETKINRITELFLTYGLTFEESKNGKVKDYPDEDKGRFKYGGYEYYNNQYMFYNKHLNQTNTISTEDCYQIMHQFQLKPPIHLLCHFPDRETVLAFDKSTDSQRQILQYQLKLLKKNRFKKNVINSEVSNLNDSEFDNLMILEAEKAEQDRSMMIKRDFFGRVIEKKVDQSKPKEEKEKVQLYFKYHEGKTDAVRRKVYIKALL